jgi:hypothetical protein
MKSAIQCQQHFKLMGVIQDKDKNIETLEEELKVSKETLNRK